MPRFIQLKINFPPLDKITPLVYLENISDKLNVEIRIKHDDSYPMCGGGNRTRKIRYIVDYALKNGYDALVANGGIQSNHARATALAAAENNLECKLILHGNPSAKYRLDGNLLLMNLAGADIQVVRHSDLAEQMDVAVEALRRQGYHPLYIWGGGRCLEGSLAYYDATKETQKQCGDWVPDYIVHATGTGTTQAGLTDGYAHLHTRIIGISVAREKECGIESIKESLHKLCQYLKRDTLSMLVDFRDDWTFGGYEKIDSKLIECIDKVAKAGLILDPTYAGKAYYGMLQMIRADEIATGSKVLFWHTGRLLNLLSTPYYNEKKR